MKQIIGITLLSSQLSHTSILKIGHRGACGYEPENTLVSFNKAIDLGCDGIELDIHKCKSGQLIVFHDENLCRLTTSSKKISELKLSQLKKLKVRETQLIPTLKEVFDLVDKKCFINIELKGLGVVDALVELINEYIKNKGWDYNNFIISSFDLNMLKDFHTKMPNIRIAALFSQPTIKDVEITKELGAHGIVSNKNNTTQELVDEAHKNGLFIWVYTVNEAEDINKIKALGVNGIISDFPDRI
ncbi:MAG: Glycerophosphoryl diester phosphodiesterase [candidate division TM6 bacterium GW2011_GWF2_32_72]|nr:MAG: Glycerophosphoryl diester phosphodiesterase [candidate division TM6 bacterium GW2011_GWF2_32_72]